MTHHLESKLKKILSIRLCFSIRSKKNLKSMGSEQSREPQVERLDNEFMVQLRNPKDLLEVCQALGSRHVKVSAMNKEDGTLWVEVTPELKEELNQWHCANYPIMPCVYRPKGTRSIQLAPEKTYYDLEMAEKKFATNSINERVSAISPPTNPERKLYFGPK
jgi:hypothetical protein